MTCLEILKRPILTTNNPNSPISDDFYASLMGYVRQRERQDGRSVSNLWLNLRAELTTRLTGRQAEVVNRYEVR